MCGACAVVAAGAACGSGTQSRQALRACVDRWNHGDMRSWRSRSVRIAIRPLDARERSELVTPDAARRVCTLSLADRPGQDEWLCRINSAGAYDCPLVTSDGMPPLEHANGATDARGILKLDVSLQGTHATPPLAWQRRYPRVDGFILPWTRAGRLRDGLGFARTFRGTCSRGSEQTVATGALRCLSAVQFDPCFAPDAHWNRPGAIVACASPGRTRVVRFVIVRRS